MGLLPAALLCALAPLAAGQLTSNGVALAGVGSASRPLGGVFGSGSLTGTNSFNTNTLQNGAGTSTLTVNPATVGGGTGTGSFFSSTFQNGVNPAAFGTGTGNFGINTLQNSVNPVAFGTGIGTFGANSLQNSVNPSAFGTGIGTFGANSLQNSFNPAAFGTGTGNFGINTLQNSVNPVAFGTGTGTGIGTFGANSLQNSVNPAAFGAGIGTFGANSLQNSVNPAAFGTGTGTGIGTFGANSLQNSVNPAAFGAGIGTFGANSLQNSVNTVGGFGTGDDFATTGTGSGAVSNSFSSIGTGSSSFGQSAATRSGTSNGAPPLVQVGACRTGNLFVDTDYNTDALYSENNGYWIVSMAPATPENAGLTWAHGHLTPASASSLRSTYRLTLYTQLQGEELKIGLQVILSDNQQGFGATGTTIPGQFSQQITYNVYYMGHSTGVWSYIYVCSDQFGDVGVDYRAVLNHGHPMTQQDLQAIRTIDARNRFRGGLSSVY